MKAGLAIEDLASEIVRQKDCKEDYIVNANRVSMECFGRDILLRVLDDQGQDRIEPLDVSPIAHRQIGTHLSIPAKYYSKMLEEDPALLVTNVNAWLARAGSQRMLRVLDGVARAFLSNRYLRMDHFPVTQAVIPILGEMPQIRFESCQITDNRMYIKVVNPALEAEVVPNDVVQAGLLISNSEVGLGSVSIQPLIYRVRTGTGMFVNDSATKRNHVGRTNFAEIHFQLNSTESCTLDDHAFLQTIQRSVRNSANTERFHSVVEMMRRARTQQMDTRNIPAVVKQAGKDFGITESEQTGVLQHLMANDDMTQYGLANAVTHHSQDVDNYDRATDLEGIGYSIMAMPQNQWNRINQAAQPH